MKSRFASCDGEPKRSSRTGVVSMAAVLSFASLGGMEAGAAGEVQATLPRTETFSQKFAADKDAIDAWRVYAGTDGNSHLEKARFSASLVAFFGAEKGLFKVGSLEVTKKSKVYLPTKPARVLIYSAPGDLRLPAHVSPGSEMFLILRGKATLLLSDGFEHEFGPGDIVILEDTTGHGHATRIGPDGFTAINFSFDEKSPVGAALTRP